MRYLALFFSAILITPLLHASANPGLAGEVGIDRIVAVVNEDVITQSELDMEARLAEQQLREQNAAVPPNDRLQKQVLEHLVTKHLQLQMAESTGIRVDDDILNRGISNIAKQNKLTVGQLRDVLERDGFRFPAFRENIREEMIINRLRERQIDNRITVTDQEVDNFLATQAVQDVGQGAASDGEYQAAQILVALPENASPKQTQAAKEKAQQVLDKLRAGADFKQTAMAVSDDQQAAEGGDLGWRTTKQLPTLFAGIVPKMQPGAISDLIHTDSGFHIIKLLSKRGGDGPHVVQQTLARHILLHTNEITSDQDAQTRLEQLKQRIEGGEDFAALARSHSDDATSAVDGGSLGWVSPGDLTPRFEEAMNALEPGQVSAPFQTQFGWHIVQVQERRDHDNSAELRRSKARELIRKRKTEEETEAWLRSLRDEAYVEYKSEE